jgi:hypothetical protein
MMTSCSNLLQDQLGVRRSAKISSDPGVIESKSNFIEHPELIANRVSNCAKFVGRENVIAGSDCGYGTWVGQAPVDADVVWAKCAGPMLPLAAVLQQWPPQLTWNKRGSQSLGTFTTSSRRTPNMCAKDY